MSIVVEVFRSGKHVGYVAKQAPCGYRIVTGHHQAHRFSSGPRAEDASHAILAELKEEDRGSWQRYELRYREEG